MDNEQVQDKLKQIAELQDEVKEALKFPDGSFWQPYKKWTISEDKWNSIMEQRKQQEAIRINHG